MFKTQLMSDKLAMTLSFACTIHCFFVPSFIILTSGSEDPNYPSIKIYMDYLDELDIKYNSLIVEGVDHNPLIFYEKSGENLIRFHAKDD